MKTRIAIAVSLVLSAGGAAASTVQGTPCIKPALPVVHRKHHRHVPYTLPITPAQTCATPIPIIWQQPEDLLTPIPVPQTRIEYMAGPAQTQYVPTYAPVAAWDLGGFMAPDIFMGGYGGGGGYYVGPKPATAYAYAYASATATVSVSAAVYNTYNSFVTDNTWNSYTWNSSSTVNNSNTTVNYPPSSTPVKAPELSGAGFGGALTLLIGLVLVTTGQRKVRA